MKYDFLVAGFAKCGTTTLHNLLQQNPQIYLPECKETFYVSKNEEYANKGDYFEKTFYYGVIPGQVVGGVEPSFANYTRRVKPYLKENTKVIFLVRNPLDYLFSYYKMCMSFGVWEWYEAYRRCGSFAGIIKENIKMKNGHYELGKKNRLICSAILVGNYIKYIKNYENVVGKDNIKIILFDDFIINEEQVINDLYRYIGVKEFLISRDVNENKSEELMPNSYLGRALLEKREYLHNIYVENRKEINKAGLVFCNLYHRYVPYIAAKSIQEKIDESAIELMHGYYKESVMKLADFIGVDLLMKWKWNDK